MVFEKVHWTVSLKVFAKVPEMDSLKAFEMESSKAIAREF